MAKDFFDADFHRALDREMARTVMHSSAGQQILREQQRRPQQQAEPEFKLRGKPGSPERLAQVMDYAQDPSLVSELAYATIGTHLQNCLHAIRRVEDSEDFEGEYPQDVIDAFTSSAKMIASVGDPQLYAAFENELVQADSPFLDYLPDAVQYAQREGQLEDYDVARAQAQSQIEARAETLSKDYRDIERRTGVAGLQAADDFVRGLGDTAYHPEMDEDALRAAARATAEAAAATERGIDAMGFLKAFDDEVARSYGPGSSWNDEQRAEWERDLRAGSVEAVERKFGDPSVHDDRAVTGMMLDDRRRETGKSMFTEQIEHAMDRHDAHSKERLPHMEAMREALVEDWERTHDPDGFNRSQVDGQGREHGGRYEQPRGDR